MVANNVYSPLFKKSSGRFFELARRGTKIEVLVKIEIFSKNNYSHIDGIGVKLICEHYFLKIPRRLEKSHCQTAS